MQENRISEKNLREKYIYLMGHAYANYFSKAYIVSYRKMPKQNKFTVSFLGKIPLKLKENTKNKKNKKKIKQFQSRTCCKHSRPLSNNYWPVIAVLQLCADCVDPNHTDS